MAEQIHKYTLQEYISIGDIDQLLKCFSNEEFYAETLIGNREFLQKVVNDPKGFGQRRIDSYSESINSSMEAMQNIQKAIEILEQGKRKK